MCPLRWLIPSALSVGAGLFDCLGRALGERILEIMMSCYPKKRQWQSEPLGSRRSGRRLRPAAAVFGVDHAHRLLAWTQGQSAEDPVAGPLADCMPTGSVAVTAILIQGATPARPVCVVRQPALVWILWGLASSDVRWLCLFSCRAPGSESPAASPFPVADAKPSRCWLQGFCSKQSPGASESVHPPSLPVMTEPVGAGLTCLQIALARPGCLTPKGATGRWGLPARDLLCPPVHHSNRRASRL